MSRWFRGIILACHAGDPGSIPGRDTIFFLGCVWSDNDISTRWNAYHVRYLFFLLSVLQLYKSLHQFYVISCTFEILVLSSPTAIFSALVRKHVCVIEIQYWCDNALNPLSCPFCSDCYTCDATTSEWAYINGACLNRCSACGATV